MAAPETPDTEIAQLIAQALRALRGDHPDALITSTLERLDERIAVVRCQIELPSGGGSSAHGVATADGPHAVEAAEDRALHRALVALGHGAATTATPLAAPPVPEPVKPAAGPSSPAEPARPEPVPEVAAPEPSAEAPVAEDDDADPPLEDVSWTEFWRWAREQGYQNKVELEALIGQSITSLSPAQVRRALRAKLGMD